MIYTAIEYGYDPVKVNCVVMRGINENEVCNIKECFEWMYNTLLF